MNVRDRFAPVAQKLLDQFGTEATLTRNSGTEAPTAAQKFNKAARTAKQAEIVSTTAVLSSQQVYDDEGRAKIVTVATLLAEPRQGDTLTIGDKTFLVGRVTATAPQGQAIIYKAEVTQ